GIRDFHVTGVQTCALPISNWATWIAAALMASPCIASHVPAREIRAATAAAEWATHLAIMTAVCATNTTAVLMAPSCIATHATTRSEERRLGREEKSEGGRT